MPKRFLGYVAGIQKWKQVHVYSKMPIINQCGSCVFLFTKGFILNFEETFKFIKHLQSIAKMVGIFPPPLQTVMWQISMS